MSEGSVTEIITAMRRARLTLVLVGLTAGGIVAGCVAHRDSWVGEVTTLSPRLCVGRHDATGACFIARSPQILTTLHIGECVEVSFTSSQDVAEPSRLKTIKPAWARLHPDDCPASRP